MLWLVVLLDRKVIDKEFGYGLVEIKCFFILRNLIFEEVCVDLNFYCYFVNSKFEFKKDYFYYY